MKTKVLITLLTICVIFISVSNVCYAMETNEETLTKMDGEVDGNDIELLEGNDLLFGTNPGEATSIYSGETIEGGWNQSDAYASSSYDEYYKTEHWYKYTVTKRGYFSVNLKCNNPRGDACACKISIFEPGNGSYLEDEAVWSSYTSKKYACKVGQAMLIRVIYYYGGDCTYNLTVNQNVISNWEIESNNSISEATSLVNGEIYGEIFNVNDIDYFLFEVKQTSKINIKLLLDRANIGHVSNGWTVGLYKAGNQSYLDEKWGWNSETMWIPKSNEYKEQLGGYPDLILDKGNYYLKVTGCADLAYLYEETYHFKVSIIPVESMTMYRMYNPNSGEHFYTADANERDVLKSVGWNYEGIAWTAPKKSNTPVYRLYNKNSGEHHYTTNAAEKNMLIGIGWNDEGIGWYSDDNMTTPLYRLYNPNAKGAQEAGAHHYTVSEDEKWNLVLIGWNDEKIGWYGL